MAVAVTVVGAVAEVAVGAQFQMAAEVAVQVAEKAVQMTNPSIQLQNGHQSGFGRSCKKQACDGWVSN